MKIWYFKFTWLLTTFDHIFNWNFSHFNQPERVLLDVFHRILSLFFVFKIIHIKRSIRLKIAFFYWKNWNSAPKILLTTMISLAQIDISCNSKSFERYFWYKNGNFSKICSIRVVSNITWNTKTNYSSSVLPNWQRTISDEYQSVSFFSFVETIDHFVLRVSVGNCFQCSYDKLKTNLVITKRKITALIQDSFFDTRMFLSK